MISEGKERKGARLDSFIHSFIFTEHKVRYEQRTSNKGVL